MHINITGIKFASGTLARQNPVVTTPAITKDTTEGQDNSLVTTILLQQQSDD
jgi:hypothetical protein